MAETARAPELKSTSMDEIRSSINMIGDLLNHGRELMYSVDGMQRNPGEICIPKARQVMQREPKMNIAYHAMTGKQGNRSPLKRRATLLNTQRAHAKDRCLESTKTTLGYNSNATVVPSKHINIKKVPNTFPEARQGTSGLKKTLMGVEEIAQARMEGKNIPSIEVAIADDNTVQESRSLEELKIRVHREMEEYFRQTSCIFDQKAIVPFKVLPMSSNFSAQQKVIHHPSANTDDISRKVKEKQTVLSFTQHLPREQPIVAHNGHVSIRKQSHDPTSYEEKSHRRARCPKPNQAPLSIKRSHEVGYADTAPGQPRSLAAARPREELNSRSNHDIAMRYRAMVTPLNLDMLRK
ncbi:unnamed protein product [Phytomonas sp. EM1]|nr:unnamed protein product [Phytomonas sp. EM1]|eukprot:CCW65287.1 unnamed protein product [Phytomonas sp. isolate EM1]